MSNVCKHVIPYWGRFENRTELCTLTTTQLQLYYNCNYPFGDIYVLHSKLLNVQNVHFKNLIFVIEKTPAFQY